MWVYSTDKTKLEEILTAINSGLGYPTSTVTTWAKIGESESNTYLMEISESLKKYLTPEQLNLVVNDLPDEFDVGPEDFE